MLVLASVFLTQLLCILVPCDPQYQAPDLGPIPDVKNELDESSTDILSRSEKLPGLLEPISDIQRTGKKRDDDATPFVRTKYGSIQGYKIQVLGGRKIDAFEGIPFAEPPIGFLRFRPPVEKSPWEGILKAVQYGPQCLQYSVPQVLRTVGQEDCLYLNVYSPKVPGDDFAYEDLKPVIVLIHGGGFFFGSASTYGPAYMLERDVVLVSIQYRVGILGFMSTGDSVCPGNYGLKDQSLALKWVSENIVAFGGDPSRVTLMGQSAGSASVHLHMLSNSTRKYFHQGISLSGTGFNYWSHFDRYQTRNITNVLADFVDCPNDDSIDLCECLRQKNPVELVTQTPRFLDDWPYPQNAFRPSIETTENNPDPFLTDYPEKIYERNEVAKIPWIVTATSGEGYAFLLFPFITFAFNTLQKNYYKLAADLLDIENIDVDRDEIIKRVTRFYFRMPPEKTSIHTYAQIVSDRSFVSGIYEATRAHSQVAPTYSYYFDYNGQYNSIVNYGYPASEWGVAHAEDLFYFFNSSRIYSGFQRGNREYEISRTLVNMITNFAAKGKPTLTDSDGEDVEVWPPHQGPDNLNYLGISNIIAMVGDPLKKRMKFWRSLHLPDTPADVVVSA